MEKTKQMLFAVLTIFLGFLTVFGIFWGIKSLVSSDLGKPIVMTISGQGKVSYIPDQAEVSFSVITKGPEAKSVQAENDQKMAKVIEFLKSSGVKEEDIKTVSYNLYPEYAQIGEIVPMSVQVSSYYRTDTSKIIGYTLDQSVNVKIKNTSKIGELVGELSVNGANRINSVSFSLTDAKADLLRDQARQKAISDAKMELLSLKGLYGFKRAKLVGINDYPYYPSPMYRDMKAYGIGGGAESVSTAPIEAGSGEYQVNISLTYEFR